ncbi:hypothetical protein AWM75_07295 [Aerococcus urinaehominis]|uniref:Uncharacterized protein n=1 Tax=Aerococcus urinaehominis TaxID=128944 RepID=A0A0X8FM01_9LACT|nr:iron export ABC transporter permease subunit FetB [Aerococcus urinaehominis]AMB99778.1 hypothetical protein AWM75_07295 [Aerococcus urinaehominis]SDM09319.1 putative ABC transport system permease protein [Aerococcus urinaehominis]
MNPALSVTPMSLVVAFSLVLIAMAIAHKEKLGLNKEIAVATVRMLIQLTVVGFLLTYVFQLDADWVTGIIMVLMAVNAAWNASKRAQGLPQAFKISILSLFLGVFTALAVLLVSGSLQFIPQQMIPITGMLVGNAMNIIGLSFRNLRSGFQAQAQQVQERIALGANPKQASFEIIRQAIKGSLQPTIDSTKMVGLVTLPGMMTGMMFAGAVPTTAVMYQIMIYFMIMATASITATAAIYQAYRAFFDGEGRLNRQSLED